MSEKNVKILFQTEAGVAGTGKAESNLTVFTALSPKEKLTA